MGQITIIKRDGTKINLIRTEPFCTVSNAVQNFTLMGDDNVQLTIRSSEMMDFGIGDKILVGGDEYSVRTKNTREIIGENKYTYEVAFYGVMYELMKSLYRNTDANGKSSKTTFDLTYTLADFVKVIIYNVSRDYPGLWLFDADNCPDTEPITFQFSKQNCLQVLQNVCKEFGYEFRIDQVDGVRIIRIGKFGAVVTPPNGRDFFEWGKGAGLYKLKEQKVDDKSVITRLWVEGGTRNIRSGYREFSDRLQFPIRRLNNHKHILADGTEIPAKSEYIGISSEDKRYLEDIDLKNKLGSIEDVEQLDEIYPKRTGEITALGSDVYSFVDDTMDFDLTEKDADGTRWLINGNTAKITFITGRLAGQEFELKETGGYVHSTRTFSIIKYTDERGLSTPSEDNEAFRFQVGDKYKITDINLPDSYVNDAEEELWYAGYDKFLDRKQIRAQYVLTFDRSYFINSLPDDSEISIFRVGDYVPVKDERFNLEKNIRIQKLSRNLLLEHDYTLTISDITTVSVQSQIVQDVLEHNKIIDTNRLKDVNKARRGWRTTEELRNMVYDTDGYFDAENIKPNSIDTNMLTVGSKSQQFILIDVILEANANGLPNRFDATAGNLVHLTIDEKQARVWNMAAASVTLAESDGYYVFAKCSKGGSSGVFYITQQQLKVENVEDPNNYYFQVGIIGSLHTDDNFRDFSATYGFTRVNGNTITTGKIITSDGECYLDLDGNKFRIGDANSSLTWANGKLILKGTLIQNQAGDTSELAVYRGTYNAAYVYYRGDEVSYTNGSETCTYRYINPTPGKGKNPMDSVYWAVVAKGEPGKDGTDGKDGINGADGVNGKDGSNGTSMVWKGTFTSAPLNPQNGWCYYNSTTKRSYTYQDGAWYQMTVDGADGANGTNGTDGLSIVWKGDLHTPPANPQKNWVYRDIDNGKVYIYNGVAWALMVADGNDGTNGTDGIDGLSVFLTYHANETAPTAPTGNGTTQGWHTKPDPLDIWMSQKVAENASAGEWGTPIKMKGEPGKDGTDGISGSAGEYYEYRYAVNGSTTVSPALNNTAAEPDGWSKTMPAVGALKYLWCTIANKSSLVDDTLAYLPINASDVTSIVDTSGNGYNASISKGAAIENDGSRGYVLDLNGTGESQIPLDLPWGKNFTICTYVKTDRTTLKWILNCYNGREFIEQSIDMSVNVWAHFAFRFNERTITVFKNGTQIYTGGTKEVHIGFSLYDDNMFGTNASFDDIRVFKSALSAADINKVISGTADKLIQNWSTPVRVNPYDGKDGTNGTNGADGAKGEKGDSPSTIFRGLYSVSKTYYGTSVRLDAVEYNGMYYIARIDAGMFSSKAPTDTSKWNTFGAQFEAVATDLLLAKGANVAGFVFRNNMLESEAVLPNGDPTLRLDGINGVVYANKGVWSGSIWYDYVEVLHGDTLNPLNPNIKLTQSYLSTDIVYLPNITSSIVGCCFNLYWDGFGSRSSYSSQIVKSRSSNILDFNDVGQYGKPNYKSTIRCDYFKYGYIKLICVDIGRWAIVSKLGNNFILS